MTKTLGAFGEAWAVGHLTRLGYRILERNVRSRWGELDIIAVDGDVLVFVEVKCRRSRRFGTPEASITRSRFQRLSRAVDQYLQDRLVQPAAYRVDVVAIEVGPSGRVTRTDVLKGVQEPQD